MQFQGARFLFLLLHFLTNFSGHNKKIGGTAPVGVSGAEEVHVNAVPSVRVTTWTNPPLPGVDFFTCQTFYYKILRRSRDK